MTKIVVLDFGSQTAQLISRRIRELGVYSEIIPGDSCFNEISIDMNSVKGFILSGSPRSVLSDTAPMLDPRFLEGVPVLGICYGFQRMMVDLGGRVYQKGVRELGPSVVANIQESTLFEGIPKEFTAWMSHGDSVHEATPGFQIIAESENGLPAAMAHRDLPLYGIQFHPEVSHCEYGMEILRNFIFKICQAKSEWNMSSYLKTTTVKITERVGDRPVLLFISGGVDSTVLATMLLRALSPSQLHLMYVDTGLMRKQETEEVKHLLQTLGARNLHIVDAKDSFVPALMNLNDSEKKRQTIGNIFIEVHMREVERLNLVDSFLAQGTLYTDMIESGRGVGTKAKLIKSHHNVRSPLVEEKRAAGRIIEPLSVLYKDEVRQLGKDLGIDVRILTRHPFPGPGLAVRIPGAITEEKIRILRDVDDVFISELCERGLYEKIWQAFAVLLPLRSVGVVGDDREYNFVCALRAVVSTDGMTADVFKFDMQDLMEISVAITNQVPEVGRVVYDISSKPPATIEWE